MLSSLADGLELLEGRWWMVGIAAAYGLVKGAKPLAKSAIKGYLATRESLDKLTASSRHGWQQLVDEAEAEYRSGHSAATGEVAHA